MSTSPLEETRRIGNRILRKGEVVKIDGIGGGEFIILGFRGDTVEVYGGKPKKVQSIRTFSTERIGARPRTTKVIRQPRGTVVKQVAK